MRPWCIPLILNTAHRSTPTYRTGVIPVAAGVMNATVTGLTANTMYTCGVQSRGQSSAAAAAPAPGRLGLGPVQRRHRHLEYADVEGIGWRARVDHLFCRASFISHSVICLHDHQRTHNPWPQVPPPSLARWSAQTR